MTSKLCQCYIVFKSYGLHCRYVKIALQEYVITEKSLLKMLPGGYNRENSIENITANNVKQG